MVADSIFLWSSSFLHVSAVEVFFLSFCLQCLANNVAVNGIHVQLLFFLVSSDRRSRACSVVKRLPVGKGRDDFNVNSYLYVEEFRWYVVRK